MNMTEENTPIVPAPPAPPAGAPPLAPLPVPPQGGAGRKVWMWVIGIVALLLVCGGLAIAAIAYTLGSDALFGAGGLLGDYWGGMDTVRWTGDGTRAVVQTYAEDGSPSVMAIDPVSGDTIADEGWVLVAVEPTGSVLWLIKSDSEAVIADQNGDGVLAMQTDGTFDSPAKEIYRWDIGSGDVMPTRAADPRWTDLPGPDGGVARFGVDLSKGVHPSELELESHGVVSRVGLPKGLETFGVVGWSPSGDYFALEELVQIDGEGVSWTEAFSTEGPERRLVIVDARTGEVVFKRSVLANSYDRPLWDPVADVVYYVDQGSWDEESEQEPVPSLMVARPDGSFEDAFLALGIERPSSWDGAYILNLLGVDETGVLVAAEGDMNAALWLVGDGVLENTGSVSSMYQPRWYRGVGLLSMETENDADYTTETSVLVLYDIHGGSRVELWRGKPIDIGGL